MEVANDSLPSLSALAGSRLAVCMVGAARTLLLPPVHASIRSHPSSAHLACPARARHRRSSPRLLQVSSARLSAGAR